MSFFASFMVRKIVWLGAPAVPVDGSEAGCAPWSPPLNSEPMLASFRATMTSPCSLSKSTLTSTCARWQSIIRKEWRGRNFEARRLVYDKALQWMVWWFLVVTSRLLVNGCTRLDQRAPVYSWVHTVLPKNGRADHRRSRAKWVRNDWSVDHHPSTILE